MATLDIFNDDAFSLSSLTAAIQRTPYKPQRLEQLGLFGAEEGINTLSVMIERKDNVLALVPVSARGAPAQRAPQESRSLRSFTVPHLKQEDAMLADEILGVRAFGTETEVETVAKVVATKLANMRRNLEYTKESHRMFAIKGIHIDAIGNQVDLCAEFGVQRTEVGFALDSQSTNVRQKSLDLLEIIESKLGGLSFSNVRVLCGKNFWRDLIEHKAVKETYLATQAASSLRGDPRLEFEYAGIMWERYRGTNDVKVGDDEAYAVPEGVVDLFIARNSPADYVETVGTMGQAFYAKQWRMEADRGVKMESQANPLLLCTRPDAVVKLKRGA